LFGTVLQQPLFFYKLVSEEVQKLGKLVTTANPVSHWICNSNTSWGGGDTPFKFSSFLDEIYSVRKQNSPCWTENENQINSCNCSQSIQQLKDCVAFITTMNVKPVQYVVTGCCVTLGTALAQ